MASYVRRSKKADGISPEGSTLFEPSIPKQHSSRKRNRLEWKVLMARNQIKEIDSLKEQAVASHIEQQAFQRQSLEASDSEVGEKEQSENNNDGTATDVAIKQEDDDEHIQVGVGKSDNEMGMIEEQSESSVYEEQERSIQEPDIDAAPLPAAVNEALEIVKDHVARASQAGWDNPHAAAV